MSETSSFPELVIGLGTGRCGTMTLAHLLNHQLGANVGHERNGTIAWQGAFGKITESFDQLISSGSPLVGDVAFYYLPYVEQILFRFPTARFVCLERDRDETVNSYLKKTKGRNHWMRHNGRQWRADIWDQSYPKFEASSKRDALVCYWEAYATEARRLESLFPTSFRIFPTDTLNSEAGQDSVLAFLEIPAEQRKLLPPQRLNATSRWPRWFPKWFRRQRDAA